MSFCMCLSGVIDYVLSPSLNRYRSNVESLLLREQKNVLRQPLFLISLLMDDAMEAIKSFWSDFNIPEKAVETQQVKHRNVQLTM